MLANHPFTSPCIHIHLFCEYEDKTNLSNRVVDLFFQTDQRKCVVRTVSPPDASEHSSIFMERTAVLIEDSSLLVFPGRSLGVLPQ